MTNYGEALLWNLEMETKQTKQTNKQNNNNKNEKTIHKADTRSEYIV